MEIIESIFHQIVGLYQNPHFVYKGIMKDNQFMHVQQQERKILEHLLNVIITLLVVLLAYVSELAIRIRRPTSFYDVR